MAHVKMFVIILACNEIVQMFVLHCSELKILRPVFQYWSNSGEVKNVPGL